MFEKLVASIVFGLLTAFAGLTWKLPASYRIIHRWLVGTAYAVFFVLFAYNVGRMYASKLAFPFVLKAGFDIAHQYDRAEQAEELDWLTVSVGFIGFQTYLGLLRHGGSMLRYLQARFEHSTPVPRSTDKPHE